MSTESASEDDNFGTENSQTVILSVLGRERRDCVLAGLYMGRSDTALLVRQAALHVWKVIVAHTPKMLREIMSTLFQLLLGCLASQSYDKRQVRTNQFDYNVSQRRPTISFVYNFAKCWPISTIFHLCIQQERLSLLPVAS